MVGKKKIRRFVWIFVLPLIWLAGACTGTKEKPRHPVHLNAAGYIYEWNDDRFYAKPQDVLFEKFTPPAFRRLIARVKPRRASTIQWIPGKTETLVLAFLYPADTLDADSTMRLTYRQKVFYRLSLDQVPVFYYPSDSVWVFTSDRKAMEKYLRGGWSLLPDKDEASIRRNRNDEAFAFWYIRPSNIYNPRFRPCGNDFLEKNAGDLWIWDVEAPGQKVFYGLGITDPQQHGLSEVFDGLAPGGTEAVPYLLHFGNFTAWFTESFPVWSKKWEAFKKASGYRVTPLDVRKYKSVKAVAMVPGKSPFLFLWSEEAASLLPEGEPVDVIDDIKIYANPDSVSFAARFYPLTARKSYPYMAVDGHKCVMARDKNTLIRVLEKISRPIVAHPLLKTIGDDIHLLWSGRKGYWSWQVDGNKVLQTRVYEAPSSASTARSGPDNLFLFDLKWPASWVYGPRWVYNHRSKAYEILFQDRTGRLVLVDAKGRVRWQKDIGDKIMGKIHQIDMFRNGKRQFFYSLPSGVYVMDVRGSLVAPFPLKKDLYVPAGLFDYDRNRRYRIAIAGKKQVELYDIHGKKIKGFRFDRLSAPLQAEPQHLRIGAKDYILLQQTDGRLWILNRRGQVRIPLSGTVSSADGRWIVYNKGFVTRSREGKWLHIDQKGQMSELFDGKRFTEGFALPGHILAKDADGRWWLDGKVLELEVPNGKISGGRIIRRHSVFWIYDPDSNRSFIIDNGKISQVKGHLADISPGGKKYVFTTPGRIIVRGSK